MTPENKPPISVQIELANAFYHDHPVLEPIDKVTTSCEGGCEVPVISFAVYVNERRKRLAGWIFAVDHIVLGEKPKSFIEGGKQQTSEQRVETTLNEACSHNNCRGGVNCILKNRR